MAKVPVFSGKKSDFSMWWSKFKALAAQKRFAKAITETGEGLPNSENDPIDETTADGKATMRKIERNALAMAAFTMAFQTQKMMNLLNKSKSQEWENGKAYEVTKLLMKRYKQDDAINKAEMMKELINVKLNNEDDPGELFEELYRIKNVYETKSNVVEDDDLIPYVLSAAPAKYHAIITSEMRDKGSNLTLDDLEEAMNDQWRLTPEGKKNNEDEDDKEGEMALSAFNGDCYKCGKPGHKASQCYSNGGDNKKYHHGDNRKNNHRDNNRYRKKFNGNCSHCGRYGHKRNDCWLLEKNKSKRPKGFRVKGENEQSAGAVDSNNEGVEFLLASSDSMFCGLCQEEEKEKLVVSDHEEHPKENRKIFQVNIPERCQQEILEETQLDEMNSAKRILEINAAGLSMAQKSFILRDPNIWVGDSGASSDSTFDDSGMVNCKETRSSITMGKGKSVKPSKSGEIPVAVHNKNGEEMYNARMSDVAYIPDANFNLFSITRRLKQGFKLGGDVNSIWLEKNGRRIVFDVVIPTPKGAIYCAYLKRRNAEVASASKSNKVISVNLAHQIFGHGDESSTRKTAKALGFEISRGTLKPCKACAAAKAKQKNLPSHGEHVTSTENNGRVFLDMSVVKAPEHLKMKVTKPHWRMIVDERTQLKFSDFYQTKNGMVEPTCEKFHKWKEAGMPVKIVRMDGAGENMK